MDTLTEATVKQSLNDLMMNSSIYFSAGYLRKLLIATINTEFIALRKNIYFTKFESSKLALICKIKISGVFYVFHTFAEME